MASDAEPSDPAKSGAMERRGSDTFCGHGEEKLNGALHDRQPRTDGIRGVWVDTGDIIFSSKVRPKGTVLNYSRLRNLTREGMR